MKQFVLPNCKYVFAVIDERQTNTINTVHWTLLKIDQTRRALDTMELRLKVDQKNEHDVLMPIDAKM